MTEQTKEIEEIKEDIEQKLAQLVQFYNRDYASPIKKDLLIEIDKKLKFYIENCVDKNLGILLLLNEYIEGIMVGFRR